MTAAAGPDTSHTIVVPALQQLLEAVGQGADSADFERAVLVDNVLGKATTGSRKRTLRYLRELYLLRQSSVLFRALRDLWSDDPAGQPLLAGLCAIARDASFRASAGAIVASSPGDRLTSRDLGEAVGAVFPDAYSELTLAPRLGATRSRPGSRRVTSKPLRGRKSCGDARSAHPQQRRSR